MGKRVLIAGASGMVGSLVFENCLKSKEVDHIVSLVREKSEKTQAKTTEVIVKDFADYSKLSASFKKIDAAFFCIGAYTGSLPDVEFKKITVDFAVEFARALKQNSPHATLCLLSGGGADRTGKSRIAFARYKGIAEAQISKLKLGRFYAFRPGYIYPVTKRKEPNFSYVIMRWFYPVFKLFGNKLAVKSTELAQAMVKAGLHGAPKEILENPDIHNILPSNNGVEHCI